MKKSKMIFLAISIPIAVPIVAFLIMVLVLMTEVGISALKYQIQHKGWTKLDYCEEQWDISLPKDNVTIEYSFSNRGGFHGDGETYTICKYTIRPDEFLQNFEKDKNGKYVEKYNNLQPLMMTSEKDRPPLDTSKLFVPNENFVWYSIKGSDDLSTLMLAYDLSNDKMYIIENIL